MSGYRRGGGGDTARSYLLTRKNATNRTSFLQAVMAAMGNDRATLKGDAEAGRVEMELEGGTHERTLARAGRSVKLSGEGYLDDPEEADLFSFLLETNEARRAVARGDDLQEIIMRPVDIDAIRNRIERLEYRKAEINDELATIESRQRDLPDLERRRNALRDRIEETREEIAEKEAAIDASSRNIEESGKDRVEPESKLDELRAARSDPESVGRDVESQRESIAALEAEGEEYEAELGALPEMSTGDRQHREVEIARPQGPAAGTQRRDIRAAEPHRVQRGAARGGRPRGARPPR